MFEKITNRAKEIINIINKFDPIGIIESGCPKDEYENEAMEIATRFYLCCDEALPMRIKDVFEFWFYEGCISNEVCVSMAKQIKSLLKEKEVLGE
jgi:hypothetical protein